jgi:hypothetical protein
MNIFVLDTNPRLVAQYHGDIHVGKMAMEASQLLSNAHTFFGSVSQRDYGTHKLCLPTHTKHPCSIWAHQSRANYLWLLDLYVELHAEFMHRFKKAHANYLNRFDAVSSPPSLLHGTELTPFALAMDHEFKVGDDAVASYRNYYTLRKQAMHKWTNRDRPEWLL